MSKLFSPITLGNLVLDNRIVIAPMCQYSAADAEQAETIVAAGETDMVALARGMLYDPHRPWHAAAKFGAQMSPPNQYLRAQPQNLHDLFKNPGR